MNCYLSLLDHILNNLCLSGFSREYIAYNHLRASIMKDWSCLGHGILKLCGVSLSQPFPLLKEKFFMTLKGTLVNVL